MILPVVRIWAVESEHDKDAVGKLARRLVAHLGCTDMSIQTAGKKAYTSIARRLRKKPDALKIAVEQYLKEADSVIFVMDSDSPTALEARRLQPCSMISRIERVLASKQLQDRVHLALAVQELEAWLLTDCVGICCYFARHHYSLETCREKIARNRKLQRLAEKYQKGDTELIVEAERGGAGAKEYLVKFSKAVLTTLNPKMRRDTVDRSKYREALAPEIVEYFQIGKESLRRNPSLQRFCDLLSSASRTN